MDWNDEVPGEVPEKPAIPGKKRFTSFSVFRDADEIEVTITSTLIRDAGGPGIAVTKTYTLSQLESVMNAQLAGSYDAFESVVLGNM